MGQTQDKEDNLQDSSLVEENSVVTESTFTVIASDSNVHHNLSFSSPSTQETHSQDFTNNSLASSLAGLTIHDNSNSNSVINPASSVLQKTSVKNTTVKEYLNGLSKTVDDDNNFINNNDNHQITEDISSSSIGSNTIITTSNSNLIDSINKKSSKEIKSTLADEAEYTIPPAIAEDVLREMLANKPSQDLLEELDPPPVNINSKGDNPSSKFKGDSVNHEKIDSPFPSKFTFPNIADKNFFVPNFSNSSATTTPPSFSFGNPSDLSSQIPFQSPSTSPSNVTTANTLQKEQQRRQWHPPVLDKFSPVLSSKTSSITMPTSSIWPPSINTTSPTDSQFSNSNLLFPQFTDSFKFDINSKNNVVATQGSSNVPSPLISNTNDNDDDADGDNNDAITATTAATTTTMTTIPMNLPPTTVSNTSPTLSSTSSTSRKGVYPNTSTGRTTTLYVSAKSSIKTVSSTSSGNSNNNIQTPLLVSPTSNVKKLPMKFGDISISNASLTSATTSTKGITISVNNSNNNSNSHSIPPSNRGFIHNVTNVPTQRQIKELPRRAKFRPKLKGNISSDENGISNNNSSNSNNSNVNNNNNNSNNNSISKNEHIINGGFNIKSEMIMPSSSQLSFPVIPPSPLFSFSTPNSEDDDDFDAEEDDGNNVNGHADWLDNANNKKKRKALQTVGGSSTTSGGVGGVMKTLTAKERANPLRRVERRSTQRNNVVKSSSNCDSMSPFDSRSVSKELDGMRPPQTTFDFSFKSISEKSAAAAAASVNAASAKRLAAVSPIQTINAKNDPFSSPLLLQQSPSTVTTVIVPNNAKKKVSTKRAAPSSALFKTEDAAAINSNNHHVHPQFAKTLKSLPPPPPLTATPKRLPNAGRKKNKKKTQAVANNNQNIQSQHQLPQHHHQHHHHHHQHNHHSHHQQQDDASSTSGSVDIQPIPNNNTRRKIKFPEKSGDWICMFCEYKLYYGDGRRSRRRPKNNIMNANNGDGSGGFNTLGDGGITPDKALAT